MLDSSRFTKCFMTMGNNWLIHALLFTYESTNTFMIWRNLLRTSTWLISLFFWSPWKLIILPQNILTASHFSSNSLYTLAWACMLHLKFQSVLVSFISQSILNRFQYNLYYYLPYACCTSASMICRLIWLLKVTQRILYTSA